MPKLIIGSQSPRRQSLLKDAGFKFEIEKIDIDESFAHSLRPIDVAKYLADKKNKVYGDGSLNDAIIITADTVVIVKDTLLGKPADYQEACTMLRSLSEDIHEVVTGVCISDVKNSHSFSSLTEVKIKALSDGEIDYYINQFKPFDKAGAYGIQEWFGLIAIEWLKGSFYNVVGLPIDRVYFILVEKFKIHPF